MLTYDDKHVIKIMTKKKILTPATCCKTTIENNFFLETIKNGYIVFALRCVGLLWGFLVLACRYSSWRWETVAQSHHACVQCLFNIPLSSFLLIWCCFVVDFFWNLFSVFKCLIFWQFSLTNLFWNSPDKFVLYNSLDLQWLLWCWWFCRILLLW